jgi:ATP-binding cassette subfamily C (CFTR/MRP) protein 4
MYAWEKAFEKIIKSVRDDEFRNYLTINFLTSLDRSINNFSHIWGSFIFFLIVHYGDLAVLSGENMIPTI